MAARGSTHSPLPTLLDLPHHLPTQPPRLSLQVRHKQQRRKKVAEVRAVQEQLQAPIHEQGSRGADVSSGSTDARGNRVSGGGDVCAASHTIDGPSTGVASAAAVSAASASSHVSAPSTSGSTSVLAARSLYPELQVALGQADTLLSLAVVHLHLVEPQEGSSFATRALAGYRRIHAHTHAAVALLVLAECSHAQGHAAAAETWLQSALAAFREHECAIGEAEALRLLGALHVGLGEEESARTWLREAVRCFRALHRLGSSSQYGLEEATKLLGALDARPGSQPANLPNPDNNGSDEQGPARQLLNELSDEPSASQKANGLTSSGRWGRFRQWMTREPTRHRNGRAGQLQARCAAEDESAAASDGVSRTRDGGGNHLRHRNQRLSCFIRCSCKRCCCGDISIVVATGGGTHPDGEGDDGI